MRKKAKGAHSKIRRADSSAPTLEDEGGYLGSQFTGQGMKNSRSRQQHCCSPL